MENDPKIKQNSIAHANAFFKDFDILLKKFNANLTVSLDQEIVITLNPMTDIFKTKRLTSMVQKKFRNGINV
jgi:hypothetical protein